MPRPLVAGDHPRKERLRAAPRFAMLRAGSESGGERFEMAFLAGRLYL